MDAAGFFYILFLVFFFAIGGIVFGVFVAQTRPAKARAKARARAARARNAASQDADVRPAGVELQHDDSTPAPSSGKATGVDAPSERSKLYLDFWEQFLNRVTAEHPGWTKRKAPTHAPRCNLPTGVGAVSYSTAFTPQGLGVQLYFGSSDPGINSGRFEALRATKDEFERALGLVAQWDDKPGKKATAICVTSQFGSVADVDLWPAMLDWVLDQHERFRQAVDAVGGLQRLKEASPRKRFAEVS
ncbi:DUF4268 domain-containing protein [Mycobacterium sp. 94-17]|uniref:DUF4268 domain-containing protein n=1 Tax=Mycobacterium sp. 94-17 TaxID=2986147 RepID=UPI002D1F08B1|nr:DUF4268 domain-containing protein [Mycobacterium sp. 94-17]MEB4208017.1 DUF4268 domain-containing protein [Mycobacterium sp. 94-17]